MKLPVVDHNQQQVSTTTLPDEIFAARPNPRLVAQTIHVYLSNQRQARAQTQTRGQVYGSRRKLWAQKGTGRARHGDKFAPQFVGGGVAHGPTGNQNFHKSLNQKMRRQALFVCLSAKAKKQQITILKKLPSISKTKEAAKLVKTLSLPQNSLLVLDPESTSSAKYWRNLPHIHAIPANQLNAYHVLASNQLVITSSAILQIKKTFTKTSAKNISP